MKIVAEFTAVLILTIMFAIMINIANHNITYNPDVQTYTRAK